LDRFELVGEAATVVVLLEVVPGREQARGELRRMLNGSYPV